MKRKKILGFIFTIPIVIFLQINSVSANVDEENSETQSKTAPSIPYTFQDPNNLEDPTGYWTKDKMKNAIPADKIKKDVATENVPKEKKSPSIGTPNNVSDPVAPDKNYDIKPLNAVVPSTAGKVFYSYGGDDYVCSASAINNDYKNLVITAGHCVHGGKGEGWHSNIAFVPAYYNGSAPYGIWIWNETRTFTTWINDSNFNQDQAFFTVYPKNGKKLINTVGGNGLSTGYGPNQPNVRIFGWPAERPYDGQVAYYCDGATKSAGWFSSDATMNCGMNGGASGGPWLRQIIDEDLGYVYAVTSRRSTSGTPALFATPNDKNVQSMFEQMK
ncbi:TPA: serine protease [Bacillus wiedmannii]|uniref:trypsin-like serine peptidase n=1 Tax=Bacillus wiedmannii TaxID=1890302 RepID=UPI000E76508B|nr:hypothetical protein BCY92_05205 [Bacillus wiedmannii]